MPYSRLIELANTGKQLPSTSTITDRIPGAQRVMLTLRLESGENVCVSMFDSIALAFHTKFDSYKKEPRIVVATSINPKIVGGPSIFECYFWKCLTRESCLPGEGKDAGSGSSKVVHAQKIEPVTLSELNHSRKEVRRIMEASPRLAIAAAQPQVYKNINLRPLTIHPLASLRRYKDLMDLCLAAGNLEAHCICGIQEYFHKNNTTVGLSHLKIAAQDSYDNGIYLYGMIMLSRAEEEEGKAMMEKLGWRQNTGRADRCWKNIKRSLHGINVTTLDTYLTAYATTRAMINYHRDDINDPARLLHLPSNSKSYPMKRAKQNSNAAAIESDDGGNLLPGFDKESYA
ncbi:hypothetical protein DY000_02063881 [Brassica cretica]|uniref:At2g35280-like TPR domain-containing protein n=1 Tax=Brassica cretica TaxID=69181 RepID=A0ABQ7B1S3_BRACR|nr:hypothetical protein DY000_02063881 [Brassica cretica]